MATQRVTIAKLMGEAAWEGMAPAGAIIVIRSVVSGLVSDEDFRTSLAHPPNWLSAVTRQ